ncbi:hypothetical protein QOT17_024855 [Balamuthia mandrillaris]
MSKRREEELAFLQQLALRDKPQRSPVFDSDKQYLLSLSWWRRWKQFMAVVAASSSPMTIQPLQEGVPPIDNFPLLHSYSFSLLHDCCVAVVLQEDRKRAWLSLANSSSLKDEKEEENEEQEQQQQEEDEVVIPYYIQQLLNQKREEFSKCELREKLVEYVDYVWVSESTWETLRRFVPFCFGRICFCCCLLWLFLRWCGGGPTLQASIVSGGFFQGDMLTLNPWTLRYVLGENVTSRYEVPLHTMVFSPQQPLHVIKQCICSRVFYPPHHILFLAWNKGGEPEWRNLDDHDLRALTLQACESWIQPQQTLFFLLFKRPDDTRTINQITNALQTRVIPMLREQPNGHQLSFLSLAKEEESS